MQVEVSTLDVVSADEARQLIQLADGLAPVGGVFHLAMVLSDRFLVNQVHYTVLVNHAHCTASV